MGLIRSTLLSAGVALTIVVAFVLPSEYNVDPLGIGGLLGLTEMGAIKQQLASEAAAQDAAPPVPQVTLRLGGQYADVKEIE